MYIQIDFKEEIKIENFIDFIKKYTKDVKSIYKINDTNSFIVNVDNGMVFCDILKTFYEQCFVSEIPNDFFNNLKECDDFELDAKLIYNNLLQKPKPLFDQGEQLDTEEEYKNLKEMYCNMSYSEILNQLNDIIETTELIVLGESKIKDYIEKEIIADSLLRLVNIGETLKNISQIQKLNTTNNVINEYKEEI